VSVSGLNRDLRVIARHLTTQAAMLGLRHADKIHYTQSAQRWEGIGQHKLAAAGDFPHQADCSSFASWCLWNGLHVPFDVPDVVNGYSWGAGFTGTMAAHGRRVKNPDNALRGDLVLYGSPPNYSHVAIVVGRRHGRLMVVSHGSEPGPFLLPYDYRPVAQIRRYI
jgi:cell wall-associated NlpC family hydrolase